MLFWPEGNITGGFDFFNFREDYPLDLEIQFGILNPIKIFRSIDRVENYENVNNVRRQQYAFVDNTKLILKHVSKFIYVIK